MSSNRPDKKPVDAPPDETPVKPDAPGTPPIKPQGDVDAPGEKPVVVPPPDPPPSGGD